MDQSGSNLTPAVTVEYLTLAYGNFVLMRDH
jgi:hypothetical protein